jgi:hypothetical protein
MAMIPTKVRASFFCNALKRLQRADEELHRHASITSHDLGAPLVNIMGFTAEQGKPREQIQHCCDLGANVCIIKPLNSGNCAHANHQLGLFQSVMLSPEVE